MYILRTMAFFRLIYAGLVNYGTHANFIAFSTACHRPSGCAAKLPRRRLEDRDLRDRTSLPELHPRAKGHRRCLDQPTCQCQNLLKWLIIASFPADHPRYRSQNESETASTHSPIHSPQSSRSPAKTIRTIRRKIVCSSACGGCLASKPARGIHFGLGVASSAVSLHCLFPYWSGSCKNIPVISFISYFSFGG